MDRCLILGGGLSGRAAARLAADIGMEPKSFLTRRESIRWRSAPSDR